MTSQLERQIDELFCQCISENINQDDQCIRIDCPCEETDCILHRGDQVVISKKSISKSKCLIRCQP